MTQQTDIGLSDEQIELLKGLPHFIRFEGEPAERDEFDRTLYTPLTPNYERLIETGFLLRLDDRSACMTPQADTLLATIDRIRSGERGSVLAEAEANLESAAAIWDRSDVPHGRANARAIRLAAADLAAAISKTERTEG